MRGLVTFFLIFCLTILPAPISAHTDTPSGKSLNEIREDIRILENVERDPTTPAEVAALNRELLAGKRQQLRLVLGHRKAAFEEYLRNVGSSLDESEIRKVRTYLDDLNGEIDRLKELIAGTTTPNSGAIDLPTRPRFSGGMMAVPVVSRTPQPQALAVARDFRTIGESNRMNAAGTKLRNNVEPVQMTPAVSDDDTPKNKPTMVEPLRKLTEDHLAKIDPDNKELSRKNPVISPEKALDLVNVLLPINPTQATADSPSIERRTDDVVIIHLVKWKGVADEDGKLKDQFGMDKENWYVFNGSRAYKDKKGLSKEEFEATRIFGKSRIIVLTIYFGSGMTFKDFKFWDVQYELGVKRIIPTPFQHLIDLLGAVVRAVPPEPEGAWCAALFQKIAKPSKLTLNEIVEPKAEKLVGDTKQIVALQESITLTKGYDNEGRYIFDFSAGLPVQGVKELQYSASDNIVRTREVTRQNAYGFFNLFFRPVDVSSAGIFREPHLVFGVPISGKPLDRPIVGFGMGIDKKNFIQLDGYIGVVFNRERVPETLDTGQAASENQLESDLRSRRVRKLSFGVNLPVGQFIKALKE